MPSIRKRKVQLEESTKTGSKKLKSGKVQKYSSSSESESDDDTSKNKSSPKKQAIQKKSLTKKHLKRARTSSTPESSLEDRNLKTDEETQFEENDSKNFETNRSSDSDEHPLVIDEDSDNDLIGLQKFMKENFKSNNSTPTKSTCAIPDVKPNLKSKSPKKNDSSPSKSKCDTPGIKSNSENKSPQKNEGKVKNDEGVKIKKKLFDYSKVDTSDSDSDVPGTQETKKKVKHSNAVKTKIDVKRKSNVTSSESDCKKKKQTAITEYVKKDKTTKKSPIKNSIADNSESDLDIEGTEKTVNTANLDEDVTAITAKTNTSKKRNLTVSESESSSEEKQKAVNVGDFKTDAKSTTVVNRNLKTVSSESESDIEASQKTVNRKKNLNKDIKAHANVNEESTIAAVKSEVDLKERQEATMSTDNLKKDVETQKGSNNISQPSSSESESDQEENHKSINTSHKGENIKVDVEKESNLNTVETGIDEEVAKDLKNTCDLPTANNDLETLNEIKKNKCSDSSDFEFSLEVASSHEEKEQESSDTGKQKISRRTVKNKSKLLRKKVFESKRKIPTPPPQIKEEPEVSSDDSAEDEDLNEIGVRLNHKTYKPTEEERLKLVNMLVRLRYYVPPQHKIESTAGTRTMTENEREEFESYVTLKHGKFSPEEDKQIKKNWKIFCQDNDWDPKKPQPFLFMKHKNKVFLLNQHSRRKFMRGLAHGLDNRCLYSVFQRFKILFEPHRTCRYESDEDRKILDYVATCEKKKMEDKAKDANEKDRKFAELAIMLRRTRASVWRRYRVLKRKAGQESKDDFCYSNK